MANKVAGGFITGANARVKIGNQVMAYCTDVSYNISVQTIPIESMGSYEVHSNEPVAYNIDGAFSVIRYTKHLGATTSNPIDASNADGNTAEVMGFGTHLDPSAILSSGTFDLEVHVKASSAPGVTTDVAVTRIKDCRIVRRSAAVNKRGVLVDQYQFVAVMGADLKTDGSAMFAADSTFQDLGASSDITPATTNKTGVTK